MTSNFIHRSISSVIQEATQYFPVISVVGPRQSGKTTLIKNLFPDLTYYSLENLGTREFASNDPIAFLNGHEEGMILDEAHNVPELFSYIQGIVDENPGKRFILSGSSQFSVMRRVSQSLAGRTAVFELMPLSYSEVSDMAEKKSLDELLMDGFYPAIYAGSNIPKLLYPSYVKTYLERDVRDLLQIRNMMQFVSFMKLCASRIGSVLNSSELANAVGVAANTIASWLSVLQASYIITLLPPYYANAGKRLIKSPKLYFNDTGLACALLDIESVEQLGRDKMRGALLENFVVSEAIKQRFNYGKPSNAYFYRDSNGNEIDLLLKQPAGLCGIEVKSSMTYHACFEKSLRHLGEWVNEPIVSRAVVYAGSFENRKAGIKILNYSHLGEILRG